MLNPDLKCRFQPVDESRLFVKAFVSLCFALLCSQLLAADFVKEGNEYVYRDTVRFEESAAGVKSLSCESVNGRIDLSGEDRQTIAVVAYVEVRTVDLEDGQRYLEGLKPTVKREGTEVRIAGEYPKSRNGLADVVANLDFIVKAPGTMNLQASCANGTLNVREMTSEAELSCANGEIHFVSDATVTGRIDASCASGKVAIQASDLHGSCHVSTANGSASVRILKQLAGDIFASTANGEIDIAVPESSSFTIKGSSMVKGSIKTDWGGASEGDLVGENLELIVNGGRHKLDCSTANGTITIRKSNEAN